MTQPQAHRIAFLNTHPIQYFAPMYAYLNRDPQLEVSALYCSDFSLRGAVDPGFNRPVVWDVDLLQGYRAMFLGKRAHRRVPGGFFSLICPQIWGEIRSRRYDAIVLHGYKYASHILAIIAAKSRGIPVFFRGDTHLALDRGNWRRLARKLLLGSLLRSLSGCFAVGTANRAYYRALGVPDERIFSVPFAVDNDRIRSASRLGSDERRAIRQQLGFPPDLPIVMYASKFIPQKHPDVLIEAMARLQDDGIEAGLLMVGDGEMRTALEARVEASGLRHTSFAGFVNQSELPRLLGTADIFALPAENEAWGLVVNEAMCASLPVIVGETIGCVPDLVHAGINGDVVRAGDASSLAAALRPLLIDQAHRKASGAKSWEIIDRWSYRECLQGIKQALGASGLRM